MSNDTLNELWERASTWTETEVHKLVAAVVVTATVYATYSIWARLRGRLSPAAGEALGLVERAELLWTARETNGGEKQILSADLDAVVDVGEKGGVIRIAGRNLAKRMLPWERARVRAAAAVSFARIEALTAAREEAEVMAAIKTRVSALGKSKAD